MRAALAALLALASAAEAADPVDPLASELIDVRDAPGPLRAEVAAPLWEAIPATRVPLAPQRTVRLPDRRANAALDRPGPAAVLVRAATDGTDLALLLEWKDAREDRAPADETDRYGDAVAVQLPLRFGAGVRLPYVGMGDEAQPVAIDFLRAGPQGTITREAIATGFGSLTRADLGGVRGELRHDPGRGVWRAALVRPLAAGALDLRAGLVPVAFAVWDSERAERGGNKSLSGWKILRLPRYPADASYAAELGWGRRPGELGDPARGRQLVLGMCAGCHIVGDRKGARPGIAPDLSAVGAIATPAYLRESIVSPSAVIVPSPNPARHQDRAAAPDGRGTYPPAEAFRWSRVDAAGRQVSRMPPYASLPKGDVDAMVAYLMTLGVEPAGAGRSR
jgi:complex iron-sulfur molybdoenzyme family reductase subunit gamma